VGRLIGLIFAGTTGVSVVGSVGALVGAAAGGVGSLGIGGCPPEALRSEPGL
jgi:hypothetical protein